MKNLGWGDAFIAFGIVGGLACIAGAIGVISSGGSGLLTLIFVIAAVVAGPRLIIKGIHQKAADVQARRVTTSPPPRQG